MSEKSFGGSENIDDIVESTKKHPDLQEGLNHEFVEALEKLGGQLGNFEHIDVFKGRKEGTLKPNSLVFMTIADGKKDYATFVEYGSDRKVHGQTISIFYVDKNKDILAIMGVDTEIKFDEQGNKTKVLDRPKIFSTMLMNAHDPGVTGKEFYDFLLAVSNHIKNGGDIDKIKYNQRDNRIKVIS